MTRGWFKHIVGTTTHKFWVARNLAAWVWCDYKDCLVDPLCEFPPVNLYAALAKRAIVHDLSKYSWTEAEGFARTSDRLRSTTYGTPEYAAMLRQIKPSIAHHYTRNSHHPEHHPEGICGMGKADRIEMVADWGAAVRRHADGDLDVSIKKNATRFDYGAGTELELRRFAVQMGLLQ